MRRAPRVCLERLSGNSSDDRRRQHAASGRLRGRCFPVGGRQRTGPGHTFGQALFGAANLKVSTTSGTITLSRSTTEPALGLSAGVDVNGGLPVGLRFQIGWLRVFADEASNVFTFSVGDRLHVSEGLIDDGGT